MRTIPRSAVILSAGRSLRMGTAKALLPWGSQSLLACWIQRFVEVGVESVAVVLGPEGSFIEASVSAELPEGLDVRWVVNPAPGRGGPRESLLFGLDALPADGPAWFTPVDVPVPSAECLLLLRDAWPGDGPPPLAVVPTYEDRMGHPVLAGPDFVARLFQGETGDRIDELLRWATRRLLRVAVDAPEVLVDMNDPEDYARAAPSAS